MKYNLRLIFFEKNTHAVIILDITDKYFLINFRKVLFHFKLQFVQRRFGLIAKNNLLRIITHYLPDNF